MFTKEKAIALAKLNNRDCKIAMAHINDWFLSNDTELWHVYGSYSDNKARAFEYCEEMMRQYDGFGLRIIAHNSMVFTVGFIFRDDDGNKIFAYITRDYDRFVYM